MRTRTTSRRTAPAAVAAAATLATGTLTWAPSAWAEAPEPQPGHIEITKKDPGGDLLAGAEFSLLDTLNGTKALQGKTGKDGILRFEGVTPGVWRLKETNSGSPIHDLAPDQDIVVTPGQGAKLTVIDPFKPAEVTVAKTDKDTGKPLAGAVINITPQTGGGKPLTLTTGKDGTATTKIDVSTRTGTPYTATETKAPDGYQLNSTPVKISAKPGEKTTATFTNTKKDQPTNPPTTPTPTAPTTPSGTPTMTSTPTTFTTAPTSAAPQPTETASSTASPAPKGSLAQTGGGSTSWLLAGAGLLISAGGGALLALRRRRDASQESQPNG
ncbi:LPXTG cell wall anchor domain-containing protein [Streptomyces bambusae]|uniref:MSCRAMM family protein n=1 Tax=Streptomyces bambusae TaxID=1550616 RepID=UPI001CFD08B3|nr:LPXTG cell wall anchor domain-containing protein [Streptomyces bambusae]MCB5163613.1 LPXTG cell wall anchor domain-containing protein [Streptomyces bambusae]